MLDPRELYPFQQTGAEWLASKSTAALCDDMGLGKTPQAIVAAERIGAKKILVVAPAIARQMWRREFETWQRIPRSIRIVASSADAKRISQPDLFADGEVTIVSYSLVGKIGAFLRGPFDLLICDEAQALKSIDAVRTRAVYGRNGLVTRAKRTWLLSGTLSPNHPGELWTHYRVLFGGRLEYWPFVDRFCRIKKTNFGQQITGANLARTAELADILRPHILQRRQRDVLPDLPALRWGHVPVLPSAVPPMPEITREMAAILGKIERDEAISVVEQMHLTTLRRWTGIAKAPAVVELIQAELESVGKIVVFAVHREVISILAAGIEGSAVINGDTPMSARQAIIDAFQNTDTPRVLILQIQVAGTALTLHRASRVLFAEVTWAPADIVQPAKRCHRIGQQHSVLASVISLAGSIDEKIAGVLTRKASELAHLENLIGAAA